MSRKKREIVFLRNGLLGGGLSIMSAVQANYFYDLGFNVTIIIDQSYSEKLFASENAKMYKEGIKIIPALTSNMYLKKTPQVKRKAERREWFGGSISKYYDEYGKLIKITWHDSDNQRVKIKIPIAEKYLSNLKKGDIVIAMEVSIGWYLGYLKLPKGVSKIYQHHNQHFYLSPWIDNSNNFTSIVVQTVKTKEIYEKLYGKKNNFTIIGNPLRISIPENIISHENRALKIVAVGHLSEGKQPLDAIKAFEIINRELPDSFLVFYGTGNLEKSLKDYVVKQKLENKVHFKGYEKNISKIFSDAGLMLFPTKRESFGLVILEAFAYGVPVVAYSTTFGVDDLIDSEIDGYIVKQSNFKDMAKKAIELLKSPNKRDIFAEAGRKKVRDYEYNKIMNEWKKLILDLSKANEKDLFNNYLKRENIPKKMRKILLKSDKENYEKIKNILKENTTVKIVNGKAVLYNKILIDEFKLSLELLNINT